MAKEQKMNFFKDFKLKTVDLQTGRIRLRQGGAGKPLILLHGNPQTHAMWHAVAPQLAQNFHVICPDLRGYGGSHKPAVSPDSHAYSKREMAKDVVALMDHIGIEKAQIAAHDRGGRVAHRLAMDHAERVEKLAVLDIIPTLEHFERTDMRFAMKYYHWFWLAQKHPFPENFINSAPEEWFWVQTSREPKDHGFFHPSALEDYLTAVRDPEMIGGMCEDYRAAAGVDLDHDRASRSKGEKIQCDMLALWGRKGVIGAFYDPLAVWQAYCSSTVSGGAVESGHYVAEESPEETLAAFTAFFDN